MSRYTKEALSLFTFDGFMNFSIGIANGTKTYNVTNFEICRDTIDNYMVDESVAAYTAFTNKSYFSGL